MVDSPEDFMRKAIDLAVENVRSGFGGPFGAVVVKEGQIIATGVNCVTTSNDPTAHAEMVAIRAACQTLHSFQLRGCEIYTSCEPCPMCLGAIYWARAKCYYYSCTRQNAAQASFDDSFIYDELMVKPQDRAIPGFVLLPDDGQVPFNEWANSLNKIPY